MATYTNDLRLKEIATGDEDGTWGTSTNTNLSLIADAFSYGTKQLAADANETFTMPDGTADGTRSFYLKLTSAGSLTATREVTLAPNTVSKVWIIENATTGSQSITIKQGSGATVTIASGKTAMVYTDGAGTGAAVFSANPTIALASQVSGTLPVANGGTGVTTSTGTGAVVLGTTPTITGLKETSSALGASNIDMSLGNHFTKTISGTTTLTVSNVPTTGNFGSFILDLTNGGSATVNLWSGIKWVAGVAPTLTTAGRDSLGFYTVDGGTVWTGLVLGLDIQ